MASELACTGTRITELSNELTSDLDACDALGIVRLLRQSDAQLFSGWGPYSGINDNDVLDKLDKCAEKAASLLRENVEKGANNMFVFSGCGTSGRIAWLCSRSFNRLLSKLDQKPCFHYLIAGGDKALIVGDELPEDDPPRGADDMKALTEHAHTVMLFGITCGLSAPYVAGQIDYAMSQHNCIPVLVGFNPVQLSRDCKIEKWHKTCRDTFVELAALERESDRAFILNPIVGPEPITGSSRMKGGSMTAILLEVIFTVAISRAFSLPLHDLIMGENPRVSPSIHQIRKTATMTSTFEANRNSCDGGGVHEGSEMGPGNYSLSCGQSQIVTVVDAFSSTYWAAYRPSQALASLVGVAGDSLRNPSGHLYYIGTQLLGILGFIDSSEMVSTYGSSPEEVRGFVVGGWTTCKNKDGDLSGKGHLYQISASDFEQSVLPRLTKHDTVIWVESSHSDPSNEDEQQISSLIDKVLLTSSKCCHIYLSTHSQTSMNDTKRFACTVNVSLPYFSVLGAENIFAGFALKLILNAISTGANVLKGRVYGNRMINLTVANDKLFYRSISIIAELASSSEENARCALIKAIYNEDMIDKYTSLPVSAHIKAAAKKNMVVPIGIVLANRQCSVEDASLALTNESNLRKIIETCKH